MSFRTTAFAGLLSLVLGSSSQLAHAQDLPNLSDAKPTLKTGDGLLNVETKGAESLSPTSAKMATMSAGTYVLETMPMMSGGCASCGAYGYSVMNSQLMSPCSTGMACGSNYAPAYPAPMTYVWAAPVYTRTFVVTPVLVNQSYRAFGSSAGGYGSYGAFGGGSFGGGSMGGGMHVRYPYHSYRRPWYTNGPAMYHRTIGSY